MDSSSASVPNQSTAVFGTFQAILSPSVLPTEASLAVQREMVLDLLPELLVDQRVVPAVLSGPRGDALPT